MKLPTRVSIALTTAITGLIALSNEVRMSHLAHQLCLIVGGLVLGLIVHPGEPIQPVTETPPPVPASVIGEQL